MSTAKTFDQIGKAVSVSCVPSLQLNPVRHDFSLPGSDPNQSSWILPAHISAPPFLPVTERKPLFLDSLHVPYSQLSILPDLQKLVPSSYTTFLVPHHGSQDGRVNTAGRPREEAQGDRHWLRQLVSDTCI